ncbi:probable NADPH:adrenodoxin oxidoreductase, mitochondrial isoform X2 [Hylaeus volcanicus]|nr:probable NADPH:adrenodoxin oxidoreductase, mitochondrial isoform X2 [Hylaeus volcanicus]
MCHVPIDSSNQDGFSSIALKTLRCTYDSVVLATGTEEVRRLNIPYRYLNGIISGDHFMKWCNGFASNEKSDKQFNLYKFPSKPKSHDVWTVQRFIQQTTFLHGAVQRMNPNTPKNPHILIIGLGNVALDVARLLLKREPLPLLPPHISALLPELHAKRITIMGRKNLLLNRFSPTQLREILSLPYVNISRNELLECVTPKSRSERKTYQLLKSIPFRDHVLDKMGEPSLNFLGECEPVKYGYSNANPSWVSHLCYKHKTSMASLPADIVVECLGYASNAKFPDSLHVYETFSFSSNKASKAVCPVFRTGWCKTGSTGALPDTITDAVCTAHHVQMCLKKVFCV